MEDIPKADLGKKKKTTNKQAKTTYPEKNLSISCTQSSLYSDF